MLKGDRMNRKQRMSASVVIAFIILIPMILQLPHEVGIFLIFVWPVAFVAVFAVLTLWTIEDKRFRKMAFIITSVAFFSQMTFTMIFQYFPLLKAFSYSMIGTGLTALTLLAVNYLKDESK